MAGYISQRVEEARLRRNEAAARLGTTQPKPEPLPAQPVQGPARRIERPSFAQPARAQVQPTISTRPYAEASEISSSNVGPIYNPEDSSPYQQETNTVGYMEPSRTSSEASVQSAPPLPYTMPAASPVADLKNRTATSRRYTREAARDLYETPTRLTVGFNPGEGIAGGYAAGGIVTSLQPSQYRSAQETLAHEHAHKWHEQRLSPTQKEAWASIAGEASNRYARENNAWHPWGNENELYAYNAERGPFFISPELREEYYPGLYRDGPPSEGSYYSGEQWVPRQGIGPYVMAERGRTERTPPPPRLMDYWDWTTEAAPFSTEQWVNEYEAPLGYYEDGSAVRAALPLPSQWSPPQWPSLEKYQLYYPDMTTGGWG